MKGINDSPVPRACSDRQVLLYPTGWEEPPPGAMEEIKISIVNDRAGGTKRERDEDTDVTSCVKRSRHAVFSCSTPITARTWAIKSKLAKNHPHSPTWHPQGENAEQGDEWDDSLLEPSDNEDDSELCLTLDEIETLLDDDDDDDSCYAAEPLQKFSEVTTCVVTFTPSESEHEGENGVGSPCITLDVSEALTKDLESEGDICNYAAMPPSPCLSAIDTVEVAIPIQSSVCNVKSPPKFLTAKTAIDSDLPTPLSGIKEVSTSLLPDSPTPELPLPPSILSGVDDEVEFIEDPDLAFDCDIDNLLAISPGDASSVGDASCVEDDNSVRLATIPTKGNSLSEVSDSTLPPMDSEPGQVLTAHAACSSTADVAQDLNTPGMPKGHHHPPAESEPLKEALPSTTSYVVSTEQKIFTDSSVTDQNVESQKLPEGETKGMPNDESASRPTDPTESAAPRANVRSKIVASLTFKATSFPGPGKEKPRIAVAALPRPSFRDVLSECELETMKNIYFNKVLMHVDSQGECNLEDPLYELASLQNQIGRENQNWQHPSDYTKRNHPRVGRKPFKRCSLHQWVTQNGGPTERFTSIPATFKRSPIPGALPFSS